MKVDLRVCFGLGSRKMESSEVQFQLVKLVLYTKVVVAVAIITTTTSTTIFTKMAESVKTY